VNNPIRYESIQEPLDEEERELMDPDNWDWENPIDVVVSDNLIITLEIDLTPEESALLSQAAAAEGLPSHRFIKNVALDAARVRLAEMEINHQTRERRSG
jgi:hypothetical protein